MPAGQRIRDILNDAGDASQPGPTVPVQEAERGEGDFLPKPGDAYQAFGRPGNKPELTLYCLRKDGFFQGFAWHTYDSIRMMPADKPGEGPILAVRFAGAVTTDVIIRGRNLGDLPIYLGQNRLLWVREMAAERDFFEQAATVITSIEFREVEG
jgi:hypothetical protein